MIPVIDQRKQAIVAQAKLAKQQYRCDDACVGWAVFESNDGLEVEACDECWHGIDDRLTDDEAAAMPEAIALLMEQHEHDGVPLSTWQRSLGYEGIPKLTDAEAQQWEAELERGKKYMEGRS